MSGQLNRGSLTGEIIFKLSSYDKFTRYVEVGTWNGEGSTKCFMDALLSRMDESCLWSIEANIEFYEQANKYWQPILMTTRLPTEKLHLLYGRLIEKEELISIEEVKSHKIFTQHPWLEWRDRNISEYDACDIILEELPSEIDVLLLDGGQFSTRAEFNKLKDRTKVVVLDDTTTYKTETIRKEIINEATGWTVIFDDLQARSGIFVACKTPFVDAVQHILI